MLRMGKYEFFSALSARGTTSLRISFVDSLELLATVGSALQPAAAKYRIRTWQAFLHRFAHCIRSSQFGWRGSNLCILGALLK